MAGRAVSTPSSRRSHIVLVPGFAGFDALGQMEYYAGVTPLFHAQRVEDAVLHYFNNLPTAAVVTRASRLQAYLAKRMARGEITVNDDVILLGHSTGGLDIRQLVWDLAHRKERIPVDGGSNVEPRSLLDRVRGAVFLSVPHWGTNIADWVRSHTIWRQAIIAELRAAVGGSQVLILDRLEEWTTGAAATLTDAGLLRAVQDALSETNEHNGQPGPARTADAQEAASQLALYLRHIASDFSAIDDLTSQPPEGPARSPAHFAGDREEEHRLWARLGIDVRSYATVGRRPFRFDPGHPAPLWELSKPWTWPECTKDPGASNGTDIVYRTCYRACAGGPFDWPRHSGEVTRRLPGAPDDAIELWDNDGIVNTASMLWPTGENVLVPGDHMDIVGHYKLIEATPGGGRRYRAYDLLGSDSGFGDRLFGDVWKEIFAFCQRDGRSR